MNFSKTASYSISLLSIMAREPGRRTSADLIHKKLGIPYQYLRQVLTDLSRRGLIGGSRGRSGGYILKNKAEDLSLSDIIFSVDDRKIFDNCIMGFSACPFDTQCPLHKVWEKSREEILAVMKNTSLADMVKTK